VTETASRVYVSIQPAPGEVIDRLSGGYRADDIKVLYTTTRLRPVNPKTGQVSDMVEFNDGDGLDRWEVQEVSNWHAPGLLAPVKHHEVTVTRIKEPG
jgi:hypothetical protein